MRMRANRWAAVAAIALVTGPAASAQAPAETIDALARDVTRLESLRAVKDLQRSYAHYAQYGLWREMAALFAAQGHIVWGDRTIAGGPAIAAWLSAHGGPAGRVAGALNTELIDDPLVNLSADGETAQVRWRGLALRGDGKGKAWIEGGLYENRYVREGGRWKIATLHYHPQYEGSYADGWTNVGGKDLPIVPFHFTPDSAGIPIPPAEDPAPKSGVSQIALAARLAALNDEDEVRNLQHAYGYYVDRRMWDDVVELFAADGVVEIAGAGVFKGRDGVRKALARMGPVGLARGDLNDRPQFDAIVRVSAGGREAHARGTELAMLGLGDKAGWEISVFRNRFVKEAGIWKIREMRIQPLIKADYRTGWGTGGIGGPARPALPAFLGANPATGRPVAGIGQKIVAATPLTGAIAAPAPPPPPGLADLRRRYQRSLAYEGTANVSAAYGYYLDDFQWPEMAAIFAAKGNKQSPFAGYYFGRDRIAAAATAMWGKTPDPKQAMRPGVSFHWRTQPVILVSQDGRSASLRTRLLQPRTGKWSRDSGKPNTNAGFASGMYPNDQVVLEDGIWRFWTLTIDEHYFSSPDWQGGWAAAKEPPAGTGSRPSPLMQRYPPDLAITALGRREEGFRGGTGITIDWPGILPMWFHYRNPVSGRVPEHYWPDCVPCEMLPETSMTRHGYQMPPTGPAIDGTDLPAK
jgi:hypothetical protein